MRITVSRTGSPSVDEKRAYAEYRFFRSIAPYASHIDTVHIAVEPELTPRRRFLCTVTVDLGPLGGVKTQARTRHLSAAIDRAADRTAWLVGRRVAERLRSDPRLEASLARR